MSEGMTLKQVRDLLRSRERSLVHPEECKRMADAIDAHLPQPAQAVDVDATHRHPHCRLEVTRDIAPDDGWHWCVHMPDGHIYAVSHGKMNFAKAMSDAALNGALSIIAADKVWRETHAIDDAMRAEGGV